MCYEMAYDSPGVGVVDLLQVLPKSNLKEQCMVFNMSMNIDSAKLLKVLVSPPWEYHRGRRR